ncbi:MAG: PhnD/SsuA/transferrin family substrate-binding protein [Candidatus Omnitrophota bacterium]|jgi:PAS domain S-box-containing protein
MKKQENCKRIVSKGKKSFKVRSTLIISAVLGFITLAGAQDTSNYKIGVLAVRGKEQTLMQWSQTARYLTDKLPGVRFSIVPLSFSEVGPAVKNKTIDFIIANPYQYVEIETLYGAQRLASMKKVILGKEVTRYGSVIFTQSGRRDIVILSDLKNKKFMAVDNTSFGGWLAAWRELKEYHIDPFRDFVLLDFAGSTDTVVYAVLQGIADAGCVRSGILEEMAAEGKIDIRKLKVIRAGTQKKNILKNNEPFLCSTRLYPDWVFVKLSHVSTAVAEEVNLALFAMPSLDPAALSGKYGGWTIPLNFSSVHECLKELRIGIYKDWGKFTLFDAIRKYRYWLEFVTALFLALFIFSGMLLRGKMSLEQSRKRLEKEIGVRKQAEAELEQQHELLRKVMESIVLPLYVIDVKDYTVKMANQIAYKGVLGSNVTCFSVSHKAKAPCEGQHVCPMEEIKKTGKSAVVEHVHEDEYGNSRILEIHGYPVFNEQGTLVQIIEFCMDITERKKMEIELLKSQAELLLIFNNAPVIMLLVDKDRRVSRVNQFGLDITQRSQEEVVGLQGGDILSCIYALDDPRGCGYKEFCASCIVRQTVLDSFETGNNHRRVETELTIKSKEKIELKYLLLSTTVIVYNSEKMVLVCIEDVTEQRTMLGALKESERRFREIMENSQLICVMFDTTGCVTFCNDFFVNLTGWQRDEVIGKDWFSYFIPPAIKDKIKPILIGDILKGDIPVYYEHDLITLLGEKKNILWNSTVLRDAQGVVIGMSSIGEDITERKKVEMQILENEEQLRLALEGSKMGTWRWMIKEQKVTWDKYMYRIFGLPLDSFGGRFEDFISFIYLEDKKRVVTAIDALIKERKEFDLEYRILWHDNSLHYIAIRGKVFYDYDGAPVAINGVCLDISERKKIEETLQNKIEDLEKFNRFVVDRELKMVELKQKIKELESNKSVV